MKRSDHFHSDDPVAAVKFVVSEAVAALWESVLRNGRRRPCAAERLRLAGGMLVAYCPRPGWQAKTAHIARVRRLARARPGGFL